MTLSGSILPQVMSSAVFRAVRYDPGIYMTSSLEDAKHRCLSIGTPSVFFFDTPGAEIGFVDLDFLLEGRTFFTEGNDPFPNLMQIEVDGIPVQPSQG
jgi:hypothetical protein